MDQPPYTSEQFREDVQRQLVSTTIAALSDAKLEWGQVAPFLDAGRAVCRDDVRHNARVAIHGLEYAGMELAEADEAYLSLSVSDRDNGVEWLSHTWWLSDLALADQDLDRVRSAIAAIERSLARLREWVAVREAAQEPIAGDPPSEPPALPKD